MSKLSKVDKMSTPEEVKDKLGDLFKLEDYGSFKHYLGDDIADKIDDPAIDSFEWKIKTHNSINLPSWVSEKVLNDDVFASTVDRLEQKLRADLVTKYGDTIKESYDWVDEWYQEGRSGGWFVIVPNEKLEGLWNELGEFKIYSEEDSNEDDQYFTVKQLDLLLDRVEEIRKDLKNIGNDVYAMMRAYGKLISSDKFWKEELENYKDK